MSESKPLAKQLQKAQRTARLKPLTLQERMLRAKKAKKAKREAEMRTLTAAGLRPDFAAKLQDAARRAETDPEARALLDRARLARRIDVAKRESGIGDVSRTPTRFMGAAQPEYEAAVDNPTKAIPPRLSDLRQAAEQPQQRKGRGRGAR